MTHAPPVATEPAGRTPGAPASEPAFGSTARGAARPRASRRAQAHALLRKSYAYQASAKWTNFGLLAAPIFFCIALLLVETGVKKLFSGEAYQCGCQCTRCCVGGLNNCTSLADGVCEGTCLQTNTSACGLKFSKLKQYPWCPIPHASSWPAVLQTPAPEDRAAPFRPKAAMLWTGSSPLAQQLSESLLPSPRLQATMLLTAQKYLDAFSADLGSAPGTAEAHAPTVAGELLAMLGFKLGSAAAVGGGLYVDQAFNVEGGKPLFTLWPDGSCEALGLQGRKNTSLTEALEAVVNASNPPAVAALLNERLHGLTDTLAGGTAPSSAAKAVLSLRLACTDVVLARSPSVPALERSLYCGYRQASCAAHAGGGQASQAAGGGAQVAPAEANAYLAGIDWRGSAPGVFEPVVFFNDTYGASGAVGAGASWSISYQRKADLLSLAVNAWLRTTLGNSTAELIGLMPMPTLATLPSLDWSGFLGPVFATWITQLLLPVFLRQLVYEKERRLRMMMKMHGLGDAAYWAVTYAWFLALYCAYMAVFVLIGALTGLGIFSRNHLGLQVVTYFLFGNAMVALAFLLSCLLSSTRTAAIVAYMLVFFSGVVGALLLSELANKDAAFALGARLLQFIPSLALYRALLELGDYSVRAGQFNIPGMGVADLWHPSNDTRNVWAMLVAEWVAALLLAAYLEQVYASGTGNRRPALFFLQPLKRWLPGRWRSSRAQPAAKELRRSSDLQLPSVARPDSAMSMAAADEAKQQLEVSGAARIFKRGAAKGQDAAAAAAAAAAAEPAPPEDVAAEARRVAGLTDFLQHPIVLADLNKTYPAAPGAPPKLAVRSLTLGVQRGECFGLLGPNGAGKSTSLSMMVGLTEPSSGKALIAGHDIATSKEAVYSLMGICPQHDLLWATLTAREHLRFYGRLKGLQGAELEAEVEAALRGVSLWAVADKPSGQYSGGMQRRLSVAISFMGDPRVVYLDEPSTGLDPASRRKLWDVVKAHKPGRAIILTTHSMEEAEVLCDRLGIFVDGRLVCVGPPRELTSRWGGVLVFTISVPPQQEGAARQLVLTRLSAAARLTHSVGGTLTYELPTQEVSLSRVFAAMAPATTSAAGLSVLNWGAASESLEDVFIKVARSLGAKAG